MLLTVGFWPLGGFLVGFALGFVIDRGDFCMHSALKETVAGRPGQSVRAYLLALGIQLGLVNALAAVHVLVVPFPPVQSAAALVAGMVFGFGMALAKG